MIAPGFESHQYLAGVWERQLGCHTGRQEVSRCHTRGESQGMCNITCMPPLSSNKAEPTLALKPRGDVTRSPKQGYQWTHKKDSCPPKIKKKCPNSRISDLLQGYMPFIDTHLGDNHIHNKLLATPSQDKTMLCHRLSMGWPITGQNRRI